MLEKSNVTFQSCWRDYLFYKKEYMNIEEYKFDVQIKELSANSITICISKFDVQLITRRLMFDLKIRELSADQGIICRLRSSLQIKLRSADISRWRNFVHIKEVQTDLQIILWSVESFLFYRSNFNVQIILTSADNYLICR